MPLTRKRFLGLAGRGALGAAAYTTFGFLDRAEASSDCPAGTRTSTKRFLYRGSAVGFGGRITDPPLGVIPAQAATTLPPDGGNAEARVDGYGFHGIVYVNSAYSLVRGNPDLKGCRPVFRTVATATVNGLDVDGVVRADTIVASLESEQPEAGGELDMLPVGYFANLRIRGFAIDLRPHADLLKMRKKSEIDAYREKNREGIYVTALGGSQYVCSIFDDASVAAAIKGIPGVTALPGGRIHVDDFGDIAFGEFFVSADARRLTMMRIELASPPTGTMDFASVEGDGSPS